MHSPATMPIGKPSRSLKRVFGQQSAGTTHHLKRTRWRILPIPGISGTTFVCCPPWRRGSARPPCVSILVPRDQPLGDYLVHWADMRMSAIISDFFLHAIRTSAPYGVAAEYLARANASTLGIIGSGRYARGMAQAICAVRPIKNPGL